MVTGLRPRCERIDLVGFSGKGLRLRVYVCMCVTVTDDAYHVVGALAERGRVNVLRIEICPVRTLKLYTLALCRSNRPGEWRLRRACVLRVSETSLAIFRSPSSVTAYEITDDREWAVCWAIVLGGTKKKKSAIRSRPRGPIH